MFTTEEREFRLKRKEIMDELKLMNLGDEFFNLVTSHEEHEEVLKSIEGRVLGFFKGSAEVDEKAFDYFLFELGDLTKVDNILGVKQLAIYDEMNGSRVNQLKYTMVNTYVEFAKRLKADLQWQMRNRKGVDQELGHYQRNIRKGFGELEGKKIGASDRERILMLFPHLMYKKKLDINQVAAIWEVDRTNASRNMKKLTCAEGGNLIIESKNGKKKVYAFNPKYTFSGQGNRKEHDVKVYIDFLQKVIKEIKQIEEGLAAELGVKELKHSALATLHAIIPYFHYQTCYAVLNPTESICEDGETIEEAMNRYIEEDATLPLNYLSLEKIASIVSKGKTDHNYIKRDLYTLEQAGAIIYTANTILINPKLMWAMDDKLNNENNPLVKGVLWQFVNEKSARSNPMMRKGIQEKKSQLVKKKSSAKTRKEEM